MLLLLLLGLLCWASRQEVKGSFSLLYLLRLCLRLPSVLLRLAGLLAVIEDKLREAKIPLAFWRSGGKSQPSKKQKRKENKKKASWSEAGMRAIVYKKKSWQE